MTEMQFDVHAPGIDVDEIVKGIRQRVEEKSKEGVYNDARISRAERSNLIHMKDNQEFLDYYLQCLARACSVDIRAFDIPGGNGVKGRMMKKVKQTIWGSLKFYTYRMWTQQNQINAMLNTGISIIRNKNQYSIKRLELRVKQLEEVLEKAGYDLPPPHVPDEDEEQQAGEGQ